MIITTTDSKRFKVTEEDSFQYIGKKTINRGFWRWIAALIILWPLLILYFFVGDKVHLVKINGVEYTVNDFQYERLVKFFDGE